MPVFFLGWELWQQMTFVLACCILLVFGLGLIKVWRTNRQMRRLEIIDEEKRARVREMRRCGIDSWKHDQIPFGIRAIQRGVEVEGIWISRSNTPDASRVASSATLVAEQTGLARSSARWTDTSTYGSARSKHHSATSTTEQTLTADTPTVAYTTPVKAGVKQPSSSSDESTRPPLSASNRRNRAYQVGSYVPSGAYGTRRTPTPFPSKCPARFPASSAHHTGSSSAGSCIVLEAQTHPESSSSSSTGTRSARTTSFIQGQREAIEPPVLPKKDMAPQTALETQAGEREENNKRIRGKLRKKPPFTHE